MRHSLIFENIVENVLTRREKRYIMGLEKHSALKMHKGRKENLYFLSNLQGRNSLTHTTAASCQCAYLV